MSCCCGLCECRDLEQVYLPLGRDGDERIVVCRECSLVQTLPRPRRAARKSPKLSFAADFGNLRYHKGLMHERVVRFLGQEIKLREVEDILDIGANRGDLVRALRHQCPGARIVAVEPDARVIEWQRKMPETEMMVERFENVDLGGRRFDLITCFHTLEHVDAPLAFLEKVRKHLKPGGKLFLEVPDLATISEEGIVEEFFIDKHLYHFSRRVLNTYLRVAAFEPLSWADCGDSSLSLLAAAGDTQVQMEQVMGKLRGEVVVTIKGVAAYGERLTRNLAAIEGVNSFILAHPDKRILLWGAGRIFSAFATAARPVLGAISGLVDKYVALESVGDIPVLRPEQARTLEADCVIVFSRDYFEEIREEARGILGAEVTVLRYDELMLASRACTPGQ